MRLIHGHLSLAGRGRPRRGSLGVNWKAFKPNAWACAEIKSGLANGWVRDASDRYAMHAEMSDGSRTPKLGFQADA